MFSGIKDKRNCYLLLAFITLFLLYFFRFPILSYQSELWAEQGTNYLRCAMESGIVDNLKATDAGYLVVYPRIIALLTYYLFPLQYFSYITNLLGLLNISLFITFFCSRDFRWLVNSDVIRMFICLIIGIFIIPEFENFTYVNWSYHGIFFCLLLLFSNINSWNIKKYLLLMIVSALLSASKFHYVLFLPIYLIFIIYYIKKNDYKKGMFFLPSAIMILIQILSVVNKMKYDNFINGHTAAHLPMHDIFERVFNGIFWSIQYFAPGYPFILSVLVICTVVYIMFLAWKKHLYTKELIFMCTCIYVAFSYRSISQLANYNFYSIGLLTKNIPSLSRQDFVSYDLILIVELMIVLLIFKLYNRHILFSALAMTGLLIISLPVFNMKYTAWKNTPIFTNTIGGFENNGWEYYYPLLKNNAYYVPVNPGNSTMDFGVWGMKKNVKVLSNINKLESDTIPVLYNDESVNHLCAVYIRYAVNEKVKIIALDDMYNIITEVYLLNNSNNNRKYFYFQKDISPRYIRIVKDNGDNINIKDCSNVLIVGRA